MRSTRATICCFSFVFNLMYLCCVTCLPESYHRTYSVVIKQHYQIIYVVYIKKKENRETWANNLPQLTGVLLLLTSRCILCIFHFISFLYSRSGDRNLQMMTVCIVLNTVHSFASGTQAKILYVYKLKIEYKFAEF